MRSIRLLFLAALLSLSLFGIPGRASASQTTWHPSWTLCRLTFGEHGGFQSKVCHHYQLVKEARHPIAKTWREVLRTRTESVRVTWPRFEQPQPVYATTGGCFDVVPAVSAQTGIPSTVLRGLIRVESGGSAAVVSTDGYGSVGCTQPLYLTFIAHADPSCTAIYNPYCNVLFAGRYLAYLMGYYHCDLYTALGHYNGGGIANLAYAATVMREAY